MLFKILQLKTLQKHYTYIVQCSDGTYYTGKTKDIDRRMKQHNGLLAGGAKYTKQKMPVILVHLEQYTSNKQACLREAEIKRFTRQKKKKLIDGVID